MVLSGDLISHLSLIITVAITDKLPGVSFKLENYFSVKNSYTLIPLSDIPVLRFG